MIGDTLGVGSETPQVIKTNRSSQQATTHTGPEEHSAHSGHLGGVQPQPKMNRLDIKTSSDNVILISCIRCGSQAGLTPVHISCIFLTESSRVCHICLRARMSLPNTLSTLKYTTDFFFIENSTVILGSLSDIKNQHRQHLYLTLSGQKN